ncbi:Protein N-terminal and lysine N-methyltransferase EFM7, partial [Lachnellula cervina]
MLTDKIHFPNPTTEPEDILSSALGVIFPDDITNQHGDPSTPIIYLSPAHGAVHLTLADPRGEDNRRLFSHFLWNAAVLLGEFMEEGEGGGGEEGGVKGKGKGKGTWDVRGLDVLEVGAGTGLGGLVACLEGARRVVVSDYPAEEVLGNITANVERNITARRKEGLELGSIEVRGHEWGVLDDGFAVENRGAFARVLVADCLWMPWQHGSLRRSIAWFLSEG